ncbi:phosphate ABC transporter permease PstA, partial [Vibrio sp. V26_P1S5P106]|uniref:phosphate ABC transporter permease PstA n=2 Tax=Vibrio TaxID=662 RepID=UPI0013735840
FDAEQTLDQRRQQLDSQALLVEEMGGEIVRIPLSHILDYWYPNDMNHGQKLRQWGKQLWRFLSDNPRESNSEGGVFPAIFGTVLLVLLMSIIVMPLGVIAAVYLHEYAQDNPFTRLIRVAVINLAGVPSIVYGVFGLGFFVYTIGSSIDNLFYSDRLPAPTFGTPGLLWASLTLAVLTLPVVIVTTEEGLTRIPASVRHGSLALGATQFETIWRIVLPMASPAIITGLILAIARAAGEVAPLMLVGAVKLASNLPVDGEFPFVHLERKFMHLGFHIYDVGFQTTNIEAARPLVYATAFLLVTVVVSLNLTAIHIRNNLREKYRTLGQD